MHIIILSFHILVAIIMTGSIVAVFAAAYQKLETKAYGVMLSSFALTAVSGIGLLFVSPGSLGRICAMMSAFTLSVVFVRQYYRKQIATTSSL